MKKTGGAASRPLLAFLAFLAALAVVGGLAFVLLRPDEEAPRPAPKVKTQAEIDAEMIAGLLREIGESEVQNPDVIVLLRVLGGHSGRRHGVEIELRIVRAFQRLRPLASRQHQLEVSYAILRWYQEHRGGLDPETRRRYWGEVSKSMIHTIGLQGEEYGAWTFEQWADWYRKQRQIRQHDLARERIRKRFDGTNDLDEATQLFEDVKREWMAIFRLIEGNPGEEAAREIEAREETQHFMGRLFTLSR